MCSLSSQHRAPLQAAKSQNCRIPVAIRSIGAFCQATGAFGQVTESEVSRG